MKNLILISLMLLSFSCNAQIQEKLKGCWLPEKYVLSMSLRDTVNVEKYLSPVQSFEIFKESTLLFFNTYSGEYKKDDISKIILLLTYKSETNTLLTKRTLHEGKEKYKLPYFYGSLDIGFITRQKVDWYKKADVFISKSGDKLLFEAFVNGQYEKIYFVNGINNYKFKNFEDAKIYLKIMALEKKE